MTVPVRTVILQRVVPHYRIPLFQRLHDELGWVVATGEQTRSDALNLATGTRDWLHRFSIGRDPARPYRAQVPVDDILFALKPDAIIAEFSPQMSSTWRLSRDALTGRAKGRKLIYWSQGPNVERGFRHPVDLAVQVLRLGLLTPADAQLCYTEEGARYLRRWLPNRPPVLVAQNTVDVESFPGRDVDNSSPDNLLFVGRLTADKRVGDLVRAFAMARRKRPQLTLTVVGDGPDLPVVQRAAEKVPGIALAGPIYDDERLAPYFQRAGLFVYPGSIGLGANHALAYGVPIMIFDNPEHANHHPEHAYVIDGVTGFRVRPNSIEAFARRLVEVAGAPVPARQAMAADIARFVSEQLSIDRMIGGFRALDGILRG